MSKQTTSSHSQPLQLLGGLTAEQFLSEYWQKKPLLIRNAISDFETLISADELAGLSLEESVNSRIIIDKTRDESASKPWQVIYSPLDENVFSEMPETHWTLLVSDVEKHAPEFAEITDLFRFIPDWRIDDLMISYAPQGGSVGPHIDQYDVFLLQAQGQRRWQIGEQPVENENFIEDIDIRVLTDFEYAHDWVVNPGDLLYLPPKIAHNGVAENDCLTYSIGFRANSFQELASSFIDDIINETSSTLRYSDPDLTCQQNPGEISVDAIQKLKQILTRIIQIDNRHIESWFGKYITEAKIPLDSTEPLQKLSFNDFEQRVHYQSLLCRDPAYKFSFIRQNNQALLFVNGNEYTTSLDLAELVCRDRCLDTGNLKSCIEDKHASQLLYKLYTRGYLSFDEC